MNKKNQQNPRSTRLQQNIDIINNISNANNEVETKKKNTIKNRNCFASLDKPKSKFNRRIKQTDNIILNQNSEDNCDKSTKLEKNKQKGKSLKQSEIIPNKSDSEELIDDSKRSYNKKPNYKIETEVKNLMTRKEQKILTPIELDNIAKSKMCQIDLKNNGEPIKVVYHCGDIHITIHDNRDQEYTEVFDKLFTQIANDKEPNKVVVIAGDLLLEKWAFTPSSAELLNDLLWGLLQSCDVICIQGNHDIKKVGDKKKCALSGTMKNIQRMNSWNKHKLYFLKESGFYKYRNIMFGLSSVHDDLIIKADFIESKKDIIKIGLYHGIIAGAQFPNGQEPPKSIPLESFNGYDYVMAGDIHARNFLRSDKRVAYCSSLIQQNFGETIEHHGCLKWHILEGRCEEINIKNNYGFLTIHIDGGKIITDIKKKFPYNLHVRVIYKNTDELTTVKLCETIENILKAKDRHQIMSFTKIKEATQIDDDVKILTEEVTNINNFDVTWNMIRKQYISKIFKKESDDNNTIELTDNESIELNKIFEHHKTIMDSPQINLSTNKTTVCHKWKPLCLKFKNMFIYGDKESEIDFTKLHGIVGLLADNYSGKSTLIDILSFCLYGEHTKGSHTVDILNKKIRIGDGKELYCQLLFESNGEQYIIRRETNIKKQKPEIVQFDTSLYNVTKKQHMDPGKNNATMISLVGEYDMIKLTNMVLQKQSDLFSLGSAAQKTRLEEILGLEIFSQMKSLTTKMLSNATSSETLLKNLTNVVNKKELLETIKQSDNQLQINEDKLRKNHVAIGEKNKQIKLEQQIPTPVEEEEFNFDIDQANVDSTNILSEINKLQNEINKYVPKGDKSITNRQKEINKLNKDLNKLNRQIVNYEKGRLLEEIQQDRAIIKSKITKKKKELAQQSKHKKSYDDNITRITELKPQFNKFNELTKESERQELQLTNTKNNLHNNIRLFDKFKNYDCNKKCSNCGKECEQCANNPFANEAINMKKIIDTQNQEIVSINSTIEKINNDKNSCLSDYTEYNNLKSINTNLKLNDILKNIDNLNKQLTDLNNELKQNTSERTNDKNNKIYEEQNNRFRNEIKSIKKTRNIHTLIVNNNNKISELKLNNELILANIDKYNNNKHKRDLYKKQMNAKLLSNQRLAQYDSEKEDLSTMNTNLIKHNAELTQLIKESNTIIKIYDDNMELLYNKQAEIDLLSKYKAMVATDGIPSTLITRFMKNIEDRANMILSQIAKFSVVIINNATLREENSRQSTKSDKIALERLLKGKLLSMYKKENDSIYPYESCSGFEEFILNIAVRIGIAENALFNNPNFFVIDEGMFSRCDQKNLMKTSCIFEILKKKYDFVLLISHDMTVKGFCDGPQLYINKNEKGVSHISNV